MATITTTHETFAALSPQAALTELTSRGFTPEAAASVLDRAFLDPGRSIEANLTFLCRAAAVWEDGAYHLHIFPQPLRLRPIH